MNLFHQPRRHRSLRPITTASTRTRCRRTVRRRSRRTSHIPCHGRPPKYICQLKIASRHYTTAGQCHKLLCKLPAELVDVRAKVTELYLHSLREATAAITRFQEWTWEFKVDGFAFFRLLDLVPKVIALGQEIRSHPVDLPNSKTSLTTREVAPPPNQTQTPPRQIIRLLASLERPMQARAQALNPAPDILCTPYLQAA